MRELGHRRGPELEGHLATLGAMLVTGGFLFLPVPLEGVETGRTVFLPGGMISTAGRAGRVFGLAGVHGVVACAPATAFVTAAARFCGVSPEGPTLFAEDGRGDPWVHRDLEISASDVEREVDSFEDSLSVGLGPSSLRFRDWSRSTRQTP